LLDELKIDTNNKAIVSNIRTVFESNIQPFTKNTTANMGGNVQLVSLNKQFLSQVVIAVNRLFPNLKQEQEFKRIQISSEEAQIMDPYKIEDIREARQDNFEKQLQKKRVEFENSINLQKPKELDFSEKVDDGKIKEMDALIAETMARRKFDIDQIQHNLITEDPENWLQPQKIVKQGDNQITKSSNLLPKQSEQSLTSELGIYKKLKLKQPESNPNPKKSVTWNDEIKSNISLVIEEIPLALENKEIPKDKVDILINQVNILIDLLAKIANQNDKQSDISNEN
jgi:hypothetical protein